MQCSSWDNLFCLLLENQPVILLIAEIFEVHWITLYILCSVPVLWIKGLLK